MTTLRRAVSAVMLCLAAVGSTGASARAAPNCSADRSVDEQAAWVLMALVDDPADARSALAAPTIGGIALLGTIDDAERAVLAEMAATGATPVVVGSDEEGGRVQRFRDQFGALPSAATQSATMTPAEVEEMFADYGAHLAGAGVRIVFAPVVDVGDGPAIGSRSYGDDPAVVTAYAAAAIAGYQRAGLLPVLKHFPGHGRASADTHDDRAITPPLDELRRLDLVPFVELLGTNDRVGVMVGHLDVPGLTEGEPASLSAAAIDGLLRDELSSEGLVVSDALGMGAIRQVVGADDAVVRFLAAGGDLALVDLADVDTIHAAIVRAVAAGELSPARLGQAADRVARAGGSCVERSWRQRVERGAVGALVDAHHAM